jgi:hypothetical protein
MCGLTTTGVLTHVRTVFLVVVVCGLCVVSTHAQQTTASGKTESAASREHMPPWGVCPPFQLRDEEGNVINPAAEENADKPYSPKQTCGQCHEYEKITKGYHFTQGAGEEPTADQKARCL